MARGSVQTVKLRSGGVSYRAVWDVASAGSRRQRSKSFRLKGEAEAHLNRVMGERLAPSREPLGDYLERWLRARLEAGEIKPITYHLYRSQARIRLASLWTTPVEEVTPRRLQAVFSAAVAAGLSARSLGPARTVLSQAFGELVRDRAVSVNPVTGLRLATARRYRASTWTGAQVAAFLAATQEDDEWYVVWLTLARALVRVGELIALRWSDVDLVHGTLTVERTLSRTKDGREAFGSPKSEAGVRVIPLGPALLAALKAHKARQNERRLLLGGVGQAVDNGGDGVGVRRFTNGSCGDHGVEGGVVGDLVGESVQLEGNLFSALAKEEVDADAADGDGRRVLVANHGFSFSQRRDRHWHDLDLVFDRGDGRALAPQTVRLRLKAAIASAGLPVITPHGFRHSGGSWLVNVERVPIKIVSELMGHASTSITLDLYTHADAESSRSAIERLESMGS